MGLEPTTSENMAQRFIPNEASGQARALTHEIGGGGEGSNLPSAMRYLYNLYMLLVPVQCGRNGTAGPQGLAYSMNITDHHTSEPIDSPRPRRL